MIWDFEHVIFSAFFVAVRIGTLMTFAPFFSNLGIPMRVKAGLTIALTVLLFPVYAPQVSVSASNWFSAIGGEFVIGLVIGLALAFVFEGAQLAGQILGFQLGFSLANIIDPQTQVDTPVLSTLYQSICFLIFLQLGVHHWILRALARSFDYIPAGTVNLVLPTATGLANLAGGMLLIAVQMAAPGLFATLLADLALGFLGKASPQLPVLFVGLSVKSLLGYMVLSAAVAFWPRVLEAYFSRAISSAEMLLHLAR